MGIDSFDPVTREGLAITNLFWFELAVSALLFVGVMTVLAIALVRFRARPGDPEPRQVEGNRVLEIAWTAAPILILAVVAVFMIQTVATVNSTAPGALQVRVIGHQWWWEYQYPSFGIVTANELHLPVGIPAELTMESADVIHSYFVPQFGWMRDAVPGKTNQVPAELHRAGVFEGTCNQYCGSEHAWMREWVYADPPDQFNAWAQQQAQSVSASGARGQQVFLENTCVSCHAIRGLPGATAQVGPDLTHLGSRRTIGAGVLDNTPQNLTAWIQNANTFKPGVRMPPFSTLSQDDLGALADYLESLN